MMGQRRQSRELALQALYLWDACNYEIDQAISTVLPEGAGTPVRTFCKELAAGVVTHVDDINAELAKAAINWEVSRMAVIDRNILRLATYELLFATATPPSVVMNEAIEIAKTFSTEDSGKFVNGILDKIQQERDKKNPPAK